MQTPRWLVAVLVIALLKITAGLAGFLFGSPLTAADLPFGPGALLSGTIVLAFGGAGVLLVFGGRRDTRALYLGGTFLLVASTFSTRLALRLQGADPPWSLGSPLALRIAPDAFTPLLFWLFVRDFPESQVDYRTTRIVRIAIRAAAVAGAVLFGANLARMPAVLTVFPDAGETSLFYALLLPLSAAALPITLHKARTARPAERRRLRLFVAALMLGAVPVSIEVLLEALIPGYQDFVTDPAVNVFYAVVIYALLIFLPFATAYAVLVQHVVEVRLVVRRALQYALARYTVIALAMLPFAVFAWYAYRERSRTLADLFSGVELVLIAGATVVALAILRARRFLLEALDRRFFRERYDSRRALSDLGRRIGSARSDHELAAMLREGIDSVLHVQRVDVIFMNPAHRSLAAGDGGLRPLGRSSMLARLLAGSAEPLEIDLEHDRSVLARLPDADREWLVDAGSHLLVPMRSDPAELVGVISIGDKRSELPFDAEDRFLLSAVAASAALSVERRLVKNAAADFPVPVENTGGSSSADPPALECVRCGAVSPPASAACPACSGELEPAAVPHVLARKFRLERRLGAGGMGVVYAAIDLSLRRAVAIKTLPRVSPEAALRLRREAHAAARVLHPHLAIIYGVETWYGRPMLVFELLDGGTLADRLKRAPLAIQEVIELGIACADALHHAHGAGVLHGDIKPSNIGFVRTGVAKLLDFGVARMLTEAGGPAAALTDTETTRSGSPVPAVATTFMGTLAYLSPEVVRGERPGPGLDLWSLAVVLHESLTGRNPVLGTTPLETMMSIREAEISDLRSERPECPAGLAAFVMTALSRDCRRRPSTAREFRDALVAIGGGVTRPYAGIA